MKTTPARNGAVDTILLVRLAAATMLFAVSLALELSGLLQILLLIAAIVIAGFDIALEAFRSVQSKDYFASPIIVLLVVIVSSILGFFSEIAVTVILYKLGKALADYSQKHLRQAVLSRVGKKGSAVYNYVSATADVAGNLQTDFSAALESASRSVLKFGMAIAVLFAILAPLMTSLTYTVSIHRALAMMLVCNCGSIVASLSSVALSGLCSSAERGAFASSAKVLEALADTEVAVFDKSGIFSDSFPEVISIETSKLDRDTFVTFAAHAAYYSEQPFAQAIADIYNKEYKLELISDFCDIPGIGVRLTIGGAQVIFGKRSLFVGSYELPLESTGSGQDYYMTVAGKYVGFVNISSGNNPDSDNLVRDFRDKGVEKLVLLTEEGREESTAFAEEMRFTGLFSQCGTAEKLKCISGIKSAAFGKVMYIYANGVQTHTDADVDIRVNNRSKYADILVTPERISELPSVFDVAKKMKALSATNAIIAFVVKAIIITLSLTGYCSLWLAVLLDSAAAVATVFNSEKDLHE